MFAFSKILTFVGKILIAKLLHSNIKSIDFDCIINSHRYIDNMIRKKLIFSISILSQI